MVRVSEQVIEETDITTLRALTDYVSNLHCSALSPVSNHIRTHSNRIQHIQRFTPQFTVSVTNTPEH